ncbi:hypothetical protein QYF36_022402 [Acer negundo]|nr:hypothetical protein QYF36_022402 [Acer negundo]
MLEVDENTKQEDTNGDGSSSSSVQVTCFTDLVNDVTFHFQIIRLANQALLKHTTNNSMSVSSILGGVSANTGAGIAQRLVLKTGLNVIVVCNITKNSPMLKVCFSVKMPSIF